MEWEEMGYIFYLKKINTKAIMKLMTKGGSHRPKIPTLLHYTKL